MQLTRASLGLGLATVGACASPNSGPMAAETVPLASAAALGGEAPEAAAPAESNSPEATSPSAEEAGTVDPPRDAQLDPVPALPIPLPFRIVDGVPCSRDDPAIWEAAFGLTLQRPVDAWMVALVGEDGSVQSQGRARGDLCATAADEAACRASLPEHWPPADRAVLVVTGPFGLRVVGGRSALAELGRIETANAALLNVLIRREGTSVVCGGRRGTRVERRGTSFWVSIIEGSRRVELRVRSGGEVLAWEEEPEHLEVLVGRRPEGLRSTAAIPASSPMGVYLARMAHLEYAAVEAFRRLADELEDLDAWELATCARRCAEDEVRHGDMVATLARLEGAEVPVVEQEEVSERGLLALALENAAEGCVRETYGAAVAHRQALVAEDPRIRAMMAEIAVDETRHAALSWRVHHWAMNRLDSASRAACSAAMEEARRTLADELTRDPGPLVGPLGLPRPEDAQGLLVALGPLVRPIGRCSPGS